MLIASEFPIYGRFGYGAAVEGARYTVRADHARFREAGAGTMERVTLAALRQVAPAVYDRFRLDQPGSIERSARWWDRVLHQVEVPGADPSTDQAAIYRSPGGDLEGYVRYQGKQSWEDMRPTGVLTVEELVATTPAAYQGLWRYCCDIDLITTVEAGDRCVEEPLAISADRRSSGAANRPLRLHLGPSPGPVRRARWRAAIGWRAGSLSR